MKMAVLGCGSLIPHPEKKGRKLELEGDWHNDGPLLPIEYARISGTAELTLVLYNEAEDVQTLWAYSAYEDLNEAIENHRYRERTNTIEIGYVNKSDGPSRCNVVPGVLERIEEWAQDKDIDAVIWTDLKENFRDKQGVDFSEYRAIGYLKNLVGSARDRAKLYIQETPEQVVTKLRPRIKQELGW